MNYYCPPKLLKRFICPNDQPPKRLRDAIYGRLYHVAPPFLKGYRLNS